MKAILYNVVLNTFEIASDAKEELRNLEYGRASVIIDVFNNYMSEYYHKGKTEELDGKMKELELINAFEAWESKK